MKTEIGEYIIGAYLKLVKGCNFVDYNVRPPGGGLEGLGELDVIGLNIEKKIVYLCEVTTHIRGLSYGSNRDTIEVIKKKYKRQKKYAEKYLEEYHEKHYMFWSPVVPKGYLTEGLAEIGGLEIIINNGYTKCVDELKKLAKIKSNDEGNPFFRTLQILEHLR